MEFYTGCLTEKGPYRKKNQDSAVCMKSRKRGAPLLAACVCDGIGSFADSEIASGMVTEGISRWFDGIIGLYPDVMDEDMLTEDLEITVRELNELVFEYRKKYEVNIGCTMSLLLLTEESYYVFHVGDSRICFVEDGLNQITRDEVAVVEKDGEVKKLLANYVGKSGELWVNKLNGSVTEGMKFLLGTDGLFKKLSEDDVREKTAEIRGDDAAVAACKTFMNRVMERGERDNISCILVCVSASS